MLRQVTEMESLEYTLLLIGIVAIVTIAWFAVPILYRVKQNRRYQLNCMNGVLCLSYDDGPDPNLTPSILELLDAYSVKATFFIIGEKATLYPDLIREIKRRGHEIGSHSQKHRDAWRSFPMLSFLDTRAGHRSVESCAGECGIFRPPYGRLDLLTLLWLRMHRLQPVWWTHDSADCRYGDKSVEELVSEIDESKGGIVLMHDFLPNNQLDCEERKEYVLDCTKKLLDLTKKRNWKCVKAVEYVSQLTLRSKARYS